METKGKSGLREFDVEVVTSMSKKMRVATEDYKVGYDEGDDLMYVDTEEVDFEREYRERHYTIPELLVELETYLRKDLLVYKGYRSREDVLGAMLQDCLGWTEDFTEVSEG